MPPVRALSRGLAVLEALARAAHPMTPAEIALGVNLDRATVSRFLSTLVREGYVGKTRPGRYGLTSRLIEIASGGGFAPGLREAALPIMRELRDRYEETVHLGIVDGPRVVYIEKLEPSHQRVALVTSVGQSMPVHSTALGKAILSHMAEAAARTILDELNFEPKTPATITSRTQYVEALALTRKRGYAVDHGENLPDASCVAAPIRGVGGEVLGALSLSSPTFRLADRFAELGPVVRDGAMRISVALGYRDRAVSDSQSG
jgi:DNA-binding IclR family transcriptional regulator